jgi:hypothetical protein
MCQQQLYNPIYGSATAVQSCLCASNSCTILFMVQQQLHNSCLCVSNSCTIPVCVSATDVQSCMCVSISCTILFMCQKQMYNPVYVSATAVKSCALCVSIAVQSVYVSATAVQSCLCVSNSCPILFVCQQQLYNPVCVSIAVQSVYVSATAVQSLYVSALDSYCTFLLYVN